MAPSGSKLNSASSEGGQSSYHAGINACLARGKALRKLQASVKFGPETLLLPDGSCDLTLGSLMEAEGLSYTDAVSVMMKFRKEAGLGQPEANPKAAPGTLPTFAKAPKKKVPAMEREEDMDPPTVLLKKNAVDEGKEAAKAKDKRKHQHAEESAPATKPKKAKGTSVEAECEPTSSASSSKQKAKKTKKIAEEAVEEEEEKEPKKTKSSKKRAAEEVQESETKKVPAKRTGLRKMPGKLSTCGPVPHVCWVCCLNFWDPAGLRVLSSLYVHLLSNEAPALGIHVVYCQLL